MDAFCCKCEKNIDTGDSDDFVERFSAIAEHVLGQHKRKVAIILRGENIVLVTEW